MISEDVRKELLNSKNVDSFRRTIEKHGVNCEDLDIFGYTLLHHTCQLGLVDFCMYLVEKEKVSSFVVNMRNGYTPLHMATRVGNEKVVKYLVEKCSSDPMKMDHYGYTCVHYSARLNFPKILEFFIDECNVDVNTQNQLGNTPLHEALEEGSFETMKLLLRNNANTQITNDEDESCEALSKKGNKRIQALFLGTELPEEEEIDEEDEGEMIFSRSSICSSSKRMEKRTSSSAFSTPRSSKRYEDSGMIRMETNPYVSPSVVSTSAISAIDVNSRKDMKSIKRISKELQRNTKEIRRLIKSDKMRNMIREYFIFGIFGLLLLLVYISLSK